MAVLEGDGGISGKSVGDRFCGTEGTKSPQLWEKGLILPVFRQHLDGPVIRSFLPRLDIEHVRWVETTFGKIALVGIDELDRCLITDFKRRLQCPLVLVHKIAVVDDVRAQIFEVLLVSVLERITTCK